MTQYTFHTSNILAGVDKVLKNHTQVKVCTNVPKSYSIKSGNIQPTNVLK